MPASRGGWRAVVAAALLAGCGIGVPAPAPVAGGGAAQARPYVVVVSLDAMHHAYLDRLHLPAFMAVALRGIRAESLVPPFPSKTFPAHYSIATGLYPGRHGIVGNVFYDPARDAWYRAADTAAVRDGSWYGGEPIWVTAERQGVRTATYYWPGSEAAIGGVRPSTRMLYDPSVADHERVDDVVRWLRRPGASRPHLVMLYLSTIDEEAHRHGPDAPQTAAAVARVDRTVQRLLDSLAALPIRDSVNVVLLSDHGSIAVSPERTMHVFDVLAARGVDTAGMRASDGGPTMSIWLGGDPARVERVRIVLADALTHADVHLRTEAPARLHVADAPRFGDLLLVARPGWILLQRRSDRAPRGGNHGWDPAVRDMHGIFIAAGPNVRPLGPVPSIASVDVHGFLAAILRLERVPATDGDPRVVRYVR